MSGLSDMGSTSPTPCHPERSTRCVRSRRTCGFHSPRKARPGRRAGLQPRKRSGFPNMGAGRTRLQPLQTGSRVPPAPDFASGPVNPSPKLFPLTYLQSNTYQHNFLACNLSHSAKIEREKEKARHESGPFPLGSHENSKPVLTPLECYEYWHA